MQKGGDGAQLQRWYRKLGSSQGLATGEARALPDSPSHVPFLPLLTPSLIQAKP